MQFQPRSNIDPLFKLCLRSVQCVCVLWEYDRPDFWCIIATRSQCADVQLSIRQGDPANNMASCSDPVDMVPVDLLEHGGPNGHQVTDRLKVALTQHQNSALCCIWTNDALKLSAASAVQHTLEVSELKHTECRQRIERDPLDRPDCCLCVQPDRKED